jgi:predicted nucleic acid-binding protein
MTLVDFVAGDDTFVDANIFVYHFAANPTLQPICSQFLQRIENQEIRGYTSLHILSEVAHRLLTMEAQAQHRWSSGKLIKRLMKNRCQKSVSVEWHLIRP